MANTLTNVDEQMVQDEVLPALKLGLAPINAFSLGISETPKGVGDIVKVNIASAKTAATYTSTFATGDTTVTSTDVTLLAPTFSSWYVNPHLEGMPTASRFLAQGREAAYAVAKSVLQAVIGNCVAANIGDVADTDKKVVTAANYDVDDQADLWSLIKTKAVDGNISAIHNIAYAANLLKDAALQDRSASGSDVLMTGELPSILGARQYYTDAFPSAITTENTGVIYTGTETAAAAFAMPQDVESGLESASGVRIITMTEPTSGIPLVWRTWVDSNTGVYWGSVFTMFGHSFLRDSAVRVVSA
jgi:hypothetical protein